MDKTRKVKIYRIIPAIGLLICIAVVVYGINNNIFTSQDALKDTVNNFGLAGPIVFMLIQIVQVVFPILPGGISCVVGVILFGPVKGFIYNYVGICIGSFFAFALAKIYGRPLLPKLFGQNLIDKYDSWTRNNGKFDKCFAIAIFMPIAPDDFLCYLAGTTAMTWRKYILIILLGKPFAILIYSMLLNTALRTIWV